MHGMLGDIVAFDRQESACTHVKADSFHVNALGADTVKDVFREVKASRRGGNGAAEPRVERLVTLEVHSFGLAVQIRRDGDCTASFQDRGERQVALPGEFHYAGLTLTGEKTRLQIHADKGRIAIPAVQAQDIIFPTLGIAYDAAPYAVSCGSKHGTVFRRLYRLKAENLNMSPARPLEMHTRRNDLGVVEYHDGRSWKKLREIPEQIFVDLPVLVMQKLRAVTLRQGILRDPVISERIIVIFDVYVGYHREISKFAAKLSNMEEIRKTHGGFSEVF